MPMNMDFFFCGLFMGMALILTICGIRNLFEGRRGNNCKVCMLAGTTIIMGTVTVALQILNLLKLVG